MVRHEVNTNSSIKWRLFIVPIKVEQINVDLYLDTYNLNNKKIGINEMQMNDYEMSVR